MARSTCKAQALLYNVLSNHVLDCNLEHVAQAQAAQALLCDVQPKAIFILL